MRHEPQVTMPMLLISLSPATEKNLIWLALMLLIDYLSVITVVVIDFRSGILRARRERKPRTSKGYRRSVEKIARYLVTLLALTAVDSMLVVSAMLFRSTMEWAVPVFPIFTTVGAIALSLIEGKSVMENSQCRKDFTSAAASATELLTHAELQRLIAAIRRLLEAHDGQPQKPV